MARDQTGKQARDDRQWNRDQHTPTDEFRPEEPQLPDQRAVVAGPVDERIQIPVLLDDAQLKEVITRIAWKNHKNGALNPRAQFRKEVPKETIACSPIVAGALGIFDCSGVSDGSAAAIIVRAEDAHRYTDRPLFVKALSFVAGPAAGPIDPGYDYTTFPEVVASAADAYAQAGIKDPRQELAMAEVHDCFTPTELVLMEDLGFATRGFTVQSIPSGAAPWLTWTSFVFR